VVSGKILNMGAQASALRVSENRLALALEAGQMGTWDWDLNTDRIEWSATHFRLLGLAPGECVASHEAFRGRVHPEDLRSVDEAVGKSLVSHCDLLAQYRALWPDATVRWIETRGRVIAIQGKAVRMIGVITDVTERKRTEDRLREAAKLESLAVLAGGIAHDFNNLLMGIMGNAWLIRDAAPPGSELKKLAERVLQAGERGAHLTRKMLAYSGRGHFMIESVELSQLVRKMSASILASAPNNVEVRFELAESLPEILADRGQLEQIVGDLTVNATEAMGLQGGTVWIRTGLRAVREEDVLSAVPREGLKHGNYVALEVEDTGHGMTCEVKKRIFDPFFTTRFTGRGLGLPAVLGIVRGHNGLIWVDSEPDRGTRVTIILPVG
jgi:two-component system cell cycle sensor histidine kinase/response regulator CckA